MEVLTYRYYKHKAKSGIVLVLSNGIIQLPKKEKVVIFVDGNLGKTGLISEKDFLDNFELLKTKVISE